MDAAAPSTGPPEAITVVGLQLAKAARLPMQSVERIDVLTGGGIVGDRYERSRHRHLSVQSCEELADAEGDADLVIDPAATRRNVTLSSGRFDRTPGARLTIGPVLLEVVRDAAPCKMLEDAVGPEARKVLRRRAGIICRVLEGGEIIVGDRAVLEPGQSAMDA